MSFGNSWEDVFAIARRLQNLYGVEEINESTGLETSWSPLEPRDEGVHMETLALKREKLSVPLEQIWKEAGYSPEDIAQMQASDEYKSRLAMMQMGMSAAAMESTG